MKLMTPELTKKINVYCEEMEEKRRINISHMQKMAVDRINSGGEWATTVYAEYYKRGGYRTRMFLLLFRNIKEKVAIRKQVRRFIKIHKVERYIFVTEAWMSMMEKGDRPFVQPSRDAKRKEAVVISEFRKGKKSIQRVVMFNRVNGINWEMLFDEDSKMDSYNSYWDFYATVKEIDKSMNKAARQINEEHLKRLSRDIAKKLQPDHKKFIAGEITIEELMKKIFREGEKEKRRIAQHTLEDIEEDEI